MIPPNGTCSTCSFCYVSPKKVVFCRRHAPIGADRTVPTQDALGQMGFSTSTFGYWPSTTLDAWCGEYEPKLEGGTT